MPDFLYFIKLKKKMNIRLNFEKDTVNLLNMRRKINKRKKGKIICTVWKIEKKMNNFQNLNS